MVANLRLPYFRCYRRADTRGHRQDQKMAQSCAFCSFRFFRLSTIGRPDPKEQHSCCGLFYSQHRCPWTGKQPEKGKLMLKSYHVGSKNLLVMPSSLHMSHQECQKLNSKVSSCISSLITTLSGLFTRKRAAKSREHGPRSTAFKLYS